MSDTSLQVLERVSRLLSYLLRHDPQSIGLTLDRQGWVEVDTLLRALNRRPPGTPKRLRSLPIITRGLLEQVVAGNDKQRFALSEDGRCIRAAQGHSVVVDLGYPQALPPSVLYHGTTAAALAHIRQEGLKRGTRHAVHLSADAASARRVGARHGSPVVITVLAGLMSHAGYAFSQASNGVWLVPEVPAKYLRIP